MLDMAEGRYESAVRDREAAEGLGWRERRRELPVAREREQNAFGRVQRHEQMRDRWGPPGDEARRKREIARQVLAERSKPTVLASQLAPPSYIVKELGERPTDPEKAKAWDRGVRDIETFRHKHGIEDKSSALGRGREYDQDGRALAQTRLRETQRRLERQQQLDRSMQRSHDLGRDMGLGIG